MKRTLFLLMTILMSSVSCMKEIHTDVLVVGGGASGISAGIQSARMGVKTMIVEETPWIGGMLTSAGVSCIDGNYRLPSGIFGEFCDSLASHYGSYDRLKTGWVSNVNFEPNVGQDILTHIASSCGPLLCIERSSEVLSVSGNDGDWVVSVRDSEGRKTRICADILIDGTELGDVARACGVDYRIGMEASEVTGESIAPDKGNDVVQDLTYVAILKDYGPDADMTIEKPEGYDPTVFSNSCINSMSNEAEAIQTLWSPENMITYGAISGGRYMINWPICGNDYYVNIIDASKEDRQEAFDKAKEFTKCFIYFIQTHLGMKNLGVADDIFPTDDGFPLFPYHRESRRIVGEAFFTVDAAARPYEYPHAYYRTGIAVGDYAVDHHHFRHPDWRNLPDLHFYPIPSFNVPMGTIIPKDADDLIIAEKSISVSNLMNGATRLQPVVMQLGQAAGALAALAVIEDRSVREIGVRQLQEALLDAGCYIMPYLDLPKNDRHFKAVQRVGATGILRGEGRNVGWANQTWFRCEEPLLAEDIFVSDYVDFNIGLKPGPVSVAALISTVRDAGGRIPAGSEGQWWDRLGLKDYAPERTATRLEAAVVLDAAADPFGLFEVDYNGNILRR